MPSGFRSVRYRKEKKTDAGTSPVRDKGTRFDTVMDWDTECQNEIGIGLDADARLRLLALLHSSMKSRHLSYFLSKFITLKTGKALGNKFTVKFSSRAGTEWKIFYWILTFYIPYIYVIYVPYRLV